MANGKTTDLSKQIIFIKPHIWGESVLKTEYWKDNTYHPSLLKFDKNTMKNEILFIGKIIKKNKSQKRKDLDIIYETVLMCNSELQINDFTKDQCKTMRKRCDYDVNAKKPSKERIKRLR